MFKKLNEKIKRIIFLNKIDNEIISSEEIKEYQKLSKELVESCGEFIIALSRAGLFEIEIKNPLQLEKEYNTERMPALMNVEDVYCKENHFTIIADKVTVGILKKDIKMWLEK